MDWGVIGLILVPVLATAIQYLSTFVLAKSNGQSAEQQKSMRMMNLLMPLMSLWFCFSMPAGLGVYLGPLQNLHGHIVPLQTQLGQGLANRLVLGLAGDGTGLPTACG